MATPGSLDFLYRYGILDHIPYEAYETGVSYSAPVNNNYFQKPISKKEFLAKNDTFERNSVSNNYSVDNKNYRESIMSSAEETKKSVNNSPNYFKGLLGGGIILATLMCLFKKKK